MATPQPPAIPPTRATGLTGAEVLALRQAHGWNELPRAPRVSAWLVLARQFTNFLVLILIAAAVIAWAIGERLDSLAIALVVALNGTLGFVQEWRAETALDALRTLLTPRALAIRDGQETTLPARDLVPGDRILLIAGDKVPADAVLTDALDLRVDESVLTGESLPQDRAPGDAEAMVHAGTAVVAGRAEAVVTAIGPATAFGQIAALTGSVARRPTDLQRRLGRLAQQLGLAALAIAAAIVALGLWLGRDPVEIFMIGLSLSVAIVPEGLPAVVTITLALGAAAMVRQKALARRLQAVEALGAASVICTDKTGTLTENKMTATRIWTPARDYRVTGGGYDPAGHIAHRGTRVRAADDPLLAGLLQTAITCSHARLVRTGDDWTMVGEPTEGALVTLAYKGWAALPDRDDVLGEVPFSSDRKRMTVCARTGDGLALFTKGAPEQVLELCTTQAGPGRPQPLDAAARARILAAYHAMADDGLRVIALATRQVDGLLLDEAEMTFQGLVGLIDPPRPEVARAIAAARAAGIRTVMITGDSPITAAAIARAIGLPAAGTVTGPDLEAMDPADLARILRHDVLFARTRPDHKLRIVAALQAAGEIVAMTGDGVNDTPALKAADIGVAMGQRGTDVAKDASDLVLLDDNFATIVRAITEGRRQFDNIAKFTHYLLSSNTGEVVALIVNIALGGPLIFLATQILWMNLITDGVTAVALGLEKADPDTMDRPPRPKTAPLIGAGGLALILCFGAYTGAASLTIFYHFLAADETTARTAAFTAMVLFEKLGVFAFRSFRHPCWRIGWLSNPVLIAAFTVMIAAQAAAVYWPPLQALLRTAPLGWDHWTLIAAFALPVVILPELVKSVRRGPAPADMPRGPGAGA